MPLLRILRLCGTTALVCTLLVSESFAAVTVYYFHRTERCTDCLLIEQMSADVLKDTFPRELADGRLVWRPTNLDQSENIHFVFDYDLDANELVVVRGAWEQQVFNKLPEVWKLVQQPEQLRTALVDQVRKHLAQPD
jgi:hypothetical protein